MALQSVAHSFSKHTCPHLHTLFTSLHFNNHDQFLKSSATSLSWTMFDHFNMLSLVLQIRTNSPPSWLSVTFYLSLPPSISLSLCYTVPIGRNGDLIFVGELCTLSELRFPFWEMFFYLISYLPATTSCWNQVIHLLDIFSEIWYRKILRLEVKIWSYLCSYTYMKVTFIMMLLIYIY